jgi:hypothetical protein
MTEPRLKNLLTASPGAAMQHMRRLFSYEKAEGSESGVSRPGAIHATRRTEAL